MLTLHKKQKTQTVQNDVVYFFLNWQQRVSVSR
jgi:hypothetical protein